MPHLRAQFTLLLCVISMAVVAQDFSFTTATGSQQAYLIFPSQITDDFRTVSFWIKPNQDWNASMSGPQPLLIKDKYGPGVQWGGRFGIYVENGYVKWTMADYQDYVGSTIQSNQQEWRRGVWYHLAFTLKRDEGMKMYVNGILQTDTDSRDELPPPPVEGADEPFYLGVWGSQRTGSPNVTFDEVRFWSVPRTEAEIRQRMCQRTQCWNFLKAGFNFNEMNNGLIDDACGGPPLGWNASIQAGHITITGAPVGTISTTLYTDSWTGKELGFKPGRDSLSVTGISLPADQGIHLYFTNGMPRERGGIPDTVVEPDGVFGVWCSDTTGGWDMDFYFGGREHVCDICSYIFSRDIYNTQWDVRSEISTGCGFTLSNESGHSRRWREEYFILDSLYFTPNLPDSINVCANEVGFVKADVFAGASYEWDNGVTSFRRSVSESGYVWVKMQWRDCIKYDTAFVELDSIPEWEWVNDTTICEGDSLDLRCPVGGDVTYLWDTGDTTRSIRVGRSGVFELRVDNGNCMATNYVTVRVIPALSVDLGKDTLMCLGQSLRWRFNPNVGTYRWWDGSVSNENRIFNEPGSFWVSLQNECFYVTDTINIDFVDCDCRIDIPNTFTPNLDRVNELTGVFTRCYFEYYEFEIYDRWGNRVFYSDDPHARWDGTFRGKNCEIGLYMYKLQYRRWTGPREPVVKTGTMMLAR
ncbi:MAG: gliding motility-associated C-terminal domain-containing protein [Flavobacteriia bacterium]|nr:gliding motility-associated C-terminal domain-containing protein [Flavobacteriia bacterium]